MACSIIFYLRNRVRKFYGVVLLFGCFAASRSSNEQWNGEQHERAKPSLRKRQGYIFCAWGSTPTFRRALNHVVLSNGAQIVNPQHLIKVKYNLRPTGHHA